MIGRLWMTLKRRVAGTDHRENMVITRKINENERVAEQVRGHAIRLLELSPRHPRGTIQAQVLRGERQYDRRD